MLRLIEKHLLKWKQLVERKVLLIRGARQIGKTYSVRALGRTFNKFVEINFEESPEAKVFFQGSLDPARLCEKLASYSSTSIIPGETLLFFDEIQACPEALSSLRFFHEKLPALHVVAAGSLLEFALAQIPSMGVGRLSSIFMYPLTFEEFLRAAGEDSLLDELARADGSQPLDTPFHQRLLDHVKTYQLIGGLPEVVKHYVSTRDLPACFKLLDDLVVSIQDDFAKYKHRAPTTRLAEVFRSIAFQAGGKFKYSKVDSQAQGPALKEALDLLIQAGLAYKVMHTHARGIPLGSQVDLKKFKVLPFDLGIHQRLLGLDIPGFMTATEVDLVNKGSLAEIFAGLEMIGHTRSHVKPALYYWHREARSSNAEVDYVIQQAGDIVPVEIKSGTRGQMQSMRLFMDERGLSRGIRISLENFSKLDRIEILPLYAATRLISGPLD